jgi:hypothetical protein
MQEDRDDLGKSVAKAALGHARSTWLARGTELIRPLPHTGVDLRH